MYRLPRASLRVTAITLLLAFASTACDDGGVEVVVQIKSDLVPGIEFTAVEVALARAQGTSASGSPPLTQIAQIRTRVEEGPSSEAAFASGAGAGSFDGVAPGTYWVLTRLVNDAGFVVVERPTIIEVSESTFGLVVVLTRDCRGVTCPAPGGSPSLLACLAGQCVDPQCHPRAPEFCPAPECTGDAECTGGSACAPPRCSDEGICLLGARSDMCEATEYCSPDRGCVPEPVSMTPDASTPDGGLVCGTICFPPGRPCFAGYVECAADAGPTCADLFQVAEGTSCGTGMQCDAVGDCVATGCTPGGRCWTECLEGTVECAGGMRSCALGATNVAPGTPCEAAATCYDGEACGGVLACDGTGTCTSPGPTRITGPGGVEGDGSTRFPTLSADGTVVVFESLSTNLVAGDANGTNDIFVYEIATGTLERVNVASDGTEANGYSTWAQVSADGRFVAFDSAATTLVPGDTTTRNRVFVRDRMMGTTERISIATGGGEPFLGSNVKDMSSDGRFILFESSSNEFALGDTNTTFDGFVHDRMMGTTERMTLDTGGVERADGGQPFWISEDGNVVYFQSNVRLPDMSNGAYIYAYDRTTMTNTRLSETPAGAALDRSAVSGYASRDGRFVAYASPATNLLPPSGGQTHVYLLDRMTGDIERISVSSTGELGTAGSQLPRISDDGTRVAFFSTAPNLVPDDTNSQSEIFLRDRTAMTTIRLSEGPAMAESNGTSSYPTLSGDGRLSCFESNAMNLAADDTNGAVDIFCLGLP